MNKKVAVLIIIGILLCGVIGYCIGKEYNKCNASVCEDNKNTNILLDTLVGKYGMCVNETSMCSLLEISKNNDKYVLSYGGYATDSFNVGSITNIQKISDNKYYTHVNYPAVHDELEDREAFENDYIIERINDNSIKFSNTTFKKITGDVDNFFVSEGFTR